MRRKPGWLIVFIVLGLLVAACGPEMSTPAPTSPGVEEGSPTPGDTQVAPSSPTAETTDNTPAGEPVSYADLVDPEDWHSLGSPDAPVTMVEYSDFQ
jgi:protein-disulfide isomerase